jgi:hypothetical protein
MKVAAAQIGLALGLLMLTPVTATRAELVNVTQHHNHDSRDGLYVNSAFTRSAVAAMKRDPAFNGSIRGNVYAQPLYIEGGPGGRAMVIAVTESNNVYALDAATGGVIWQTNVGAPVPTSKLLCGDINPLGITGTPVVDLPSRALFFDAMTTPDGGVTKKHLIFSLNVDTGSLNPGWPVDVNASARFGSTVFNSAIQNERGALAIVGGTLYVRWPCRRLRYLSRLAGSNAYRQPGRVDGLGNRGGRRRFLERWRCGQRRRRPIRSNRKHFWGRRRLERRRIDHPFSRGRDFQHTDQSLLGAN